MGNNDANSCFRLIRAWNWWRLYSRAPIRLLFHEKEPPVGSALMRGQAGGIYGVFEASVWVFPFLPIFIAFNKSLWAIALVLIISTITLVVEWKDWGSNDFRFEDCNRLRNKGYWFPDFMTKTVYRRLWFSLLFEWFQMFFIIVFLIVAGIFYQR